MTGIYGQRLGTQLKINLRDTKLSVTSWFETVNAKTIPYAHNCGKKVCIDDSVDLSHSTQSINKAENSTITPKINVMQA